MNSLRLIRGVFIGKSRTEFCFFIRNTLECNTLRESSLACYLDEFSGNLFDLFICFLDRSFPLFSGETREFWLELTDIFADSVDLRERNEYLVTTSIVELDIFSSYLSECLLDNGMKPGNPMFSVDDIVSGIEMEEEVEILRERFSRSSSHKNRTKNIVSEDDSRLVVVVGW